MNKQDTLNQIRKIMTLVKTGKRDYVSGINDLLYQFRSYTNPGALATSIETFECQNCYDEDPNKDNEVISGVDFTIHNRSTFVFPFNGDVPNGTFFVCDDCGDGYAMDEDDALRYINLKNSLEAYSKPLKMDD